jgi:tetratricopeptide (TPR) repeat protein/predicted Ser/Thr protein kinase
MSLAAGDRLGPYEILEPLGAGGMGEVYKAYDTRLSREVAIKISKEQFSARFEREARAVAALNHPHICALYDIGPDYLVMEFIDGVPLKGPLSPEEAVRFALQIADALEHAHLKGIVHRDLKPSNILVTKHDTSPGIKLLDFGIARMTVGPEDATLTQMTQAGAVMGTPAYMAPEQRAGQTADARSDIYAFGCVLYEMLMGRQVSGDRRPVQPDTLEKVLQKCLAQDPAARWQSASELKQALGGVFTRRGFRREYAFVITSVVMLIGGLALLTMEFPRNQRLTDKDVLVLADFSNTTGDTIFDDTLRTALAIQLEQSPFLKILDDEQVQQDLKLMGRAPDARITPAIAHDICVREGQKAMINGSIADLGKAFAISVQAVNCQNGATLAREQVQAEGREQVLGAISKAATGIRAKLGESLSSIQKLDRPLEQVSTPSLAAFQSYARGYELLAQGSPSAANPFFQHAIELDPNLAMAYVGLRIVDSNVGDRDREIENAAKAYALIDQVGESERMGISAVYYRTVMRDLNKALDASLLWARTYPRDPSPRNTLGNLYDSMGMFESALQEHQEALRLSPSVTVFRSNLGREFANLGRLDEGRAAAAKADAPLDHRTVLRIAFMQADSAAAEKEIHWFAGKPEAYLSLGEQSQNALIHGEFKKAAALAQQGARLAEQHDLQGAAGQLLAQVAGMGEFRGSCGEVQKIGAVAALLCSDAEGPLKAAEAQAKERPNDTLLNAVRLPTARATVAILKNQPAQAIEALQSAAPYERAYSQVPYLRGIAYLLLKKGPEAAAEFQKITDHKGANWGVVFPMAYLGEGRAWTLAGDSVKAKQAYEAFLSLWANADSDLPVLAKAKKEYAAL